MCKGKEGVNGVIRLGVENSEMISRATNDIFADRHYMIPDSFLSIASSTHLESTLSRDEEA